MEHTREIKSLSSHTPYLHTQCLTEFRVTIVFYTTVTQNTVKIVCVSMECGYLFMYTQVSYRLY